MKITIIEHAAHESAGIFEALFGRSGHHYQYVRPYEGDTISARNATHLLVMGGPMSVNDTMQFPWLADERALIRDWIAKERPFLGICLGAQLLSSAMGGGVYPCQPEYGWARVTRTTQGTIRSFPPAFHVFQLHGETYDIPPGGTGICWGNEVVNQAFMINKGLGIQFHLELTGEMIRDWMRDIPAHLHARILAESEDYLPESTGICRRLAEEFLKGFPR